MLGAGTPPPSRRRRGRKYLAFGLVGALLLASGVTLALVGVFDAKWSAPANLPGGWETSLVWAQSRKDARAVAVKNALQEEARNKIDATNLSKDFGGVPALAQSYVTKSYSKFVYLTAVKAQSPGYFVHYIYQDAARLNTHFAPKEIQRFGNVTCIAYHLDLEATTEVDAKTLSECMRTAPGLTVRTAVSSLLPAANANVVEAAWTALGGGDGTFNWPTTSGAATSLRMPAHVGGYTNWVDVPSAGSPSRTEFEVENRRDAQLLRSNYGGAPAAAASYADDSLTSFFHAYIIASASPLPYVQYEDARHTGYLAPLAQSKKFGPVTCVIQNSEVGPSAKTSDLHPMVQSCSRTGNGLTVTVDSVSGTLQADPSSVVVLVNDFWAAASVHV